MTLNTSQLAQQQKDLEAEALRVNQRLKEAELRLERIKTQSEQTTSTTTFRQTPTRITVTTNHTAKDNQTVIADMSVGDITVTLPTQSTYGVTIKRSGSSNTLTVNPGSGVTINGSSTITIGGDGTAIELTFDGTNWHIT
jgi:hypothetical protein